MDWIFSHPDDLGEEEASGAAAAPADTASSAPSLTNGPAKYKLKAFISHMGNSHLVGHYVCHILKDDRWVIYNDEKVSQSENPPKDLGYLYLYERVHP